MQQQKNLNSNIDVALFSDFNIIIYFHKCYKSLYTKGAFIPALFSLVESQ